MTASFKMLIGGDFFVKDIFEKNELFDKEVLALFKNVDYRIINFEAPVVPDKKEIRPIFKTGPNLYMHENTSMKIIKELGIDLVTIANNHIMDYGEAGLEHTIDVLNKYNINYVGAGMSIEKAKQPFFLNADGFKIGILCFAENEWSIAEDKRPGANPLDIINNVAQIKLAKKNFDKVICIIHGGHEYYHYPSPRIRKQYRFYVESGADAVVGHHTHCIGGYEVYRNSPIIYSLGNFVFTLPSKKEIWYSGLLCSLIFDKDEPVKFDLTPVEQNRSSHELMLAKSERYNEIQKKIEEINRIIVDDHLLEQYWEEFVKSNESVYLNLFSPANALENRYIRAIFVKLGVNRLFMKRRLYKNILNLIRCESHYDMTKKIFTNFLKKDLDK